MNFWSTFSLSKTLNLKLTKLNDNIVKCGFPINSFEKYSNLLKERGFEFSIIDENSSTTGTIHKVKNYYPDDFAIRSDFYDKLFISNFVWLLSRNPVDLPLNSNLAFLYFNIAVTLG